MIRLDFCLDLTEPDNIKLPSEIFAGYQESMELAGEPLPKNERHFRRLDRTAFDNVYKVIEKSNPGFKVDTARGVYVPAGGEKRIWERSWISRDTHLKRDFQKCWERGGPGKLGGDIGLMVVEDVFTLWWEYREGWIDRPSLGSQLEPLIEELHVELERGSGCADPKVMAFCDKSRANTRSNQAIRSALSSGRSCSAARRDFFCARCPGPGGPGEPSTHWP